MQNIILIGFMGSGKTTIGRLLSEKLNVPFIDLDEEITRKVGSISAFFATCGEEKFREIETKTLHDNVKRQAVISCGGGIVEKEINRALLRQLENVVFLAVDFETCAKRVAQDTVNVRPNAQDDKKFHELFTKRQSLYQEVASFTVDTTDKNPVEIVENIIEKGGSLS